MKAIRFLERNRPGTCESHWNDYEFDPVDLNDIDEFSDVFYMSTSSEEEDSSSSDNGLKDKKYMDQRNPSKEVKRMKKPSIFDPVYRAKIFERKREEVVE